MIDFLPQFFDFGGIEGDCAFNAANHASTLIFVDVSGPLRGIVIGIPVVVAIGLVLSGFVVRDTTHHAGIRCRREVIACFDCHRHVGIENELTLIVSF